MKRLLFLLTLALGTTAAHGGDWSNWRGPTQNGVAYETGLPATWAKTGTNVVWHVPFGGRTTPIIQKGHVYLINRVGEDVTQQERVMCLDEATGKTLWEHKFNVFHSDIVADRLGWTSVVGDPETDTIVAHGTQGLLVCFNRDGKILWDHSLTEEYGRVSGYGGRVVTPIIDGDLVLVGMVNASWGDQATGRTRFAAFDKRTGKVVWWASSGHPIKDTYYSTPVVAVIGGQRLVISGGGDGGVHAFKARTGEKMWSLIFGPGAVNCSPVVQGDLVYIGHGENNDDGTQGSVICVNGAKVKDGKPEEVWNVHGILAKFASPIIADDRLYICNDLGLLFCLDAKTGKEIWNFRYGKNTKGSPVLADGKIYIGEEDGKFHILKPSADKCERLNVQAFPGAVLNGSPAVANGRVFFMTTKQMFCIGLKDRAPGTGVPTAAAPKEAPPGGAVTHVQISPADVVLRPGESTQFKALGYDAGGHLVSEVKVDWSLAGSRLPEGLPPPPMGAPAPPAIQGSLSDAKDSATTKLTINPPPPPGQFGRVLATIPGTKVVGEARVRVVPKLPYKADFSKIPEGRSPGGYVNTQGKYAVAKLADGTFALKKLAVNPNALVNRANAYIGTPDMKEYTIEVEMMGTKVGDDLPDGGIIANRYTFMLAGNRKEVRLYDWEALPRIDKNLSMEYKPGTWYRLKLTVEPKGEGTVVRGKVWESGKEEPKAWTLEVEDPIGNKEGAPGLYAFSPINTPKGGTEMFFRNVSITPNKAPVEKKDPPKEAVKADPPKVTETPKNDPPKPAETVKPTPAPAPVVVESAPPVAYYYEAPRRGLFGRWRCR